MKEWIFLSTHFDDVVLSAGGMVWELVKRGEHVEIWTICAGDPPFDKPLSDYAQMLHIFWKLEGVGCALRAQPGRCSMLPGVRSSLPALYRAG